MSIVLVDRSSNWCCWYKSEWVCSRWKIISEEARTIFQLNMSLDALYVFSFAKSVSKTSEPFLVLWSFFRLRWCFTPFYMKYCVYVWVAAAPYCYLNMLDNLIKTIALIVGSNFLFSLETVGHRWNVAILNLFHRNYLNE